MLTIHKELKILISNLFVEVNAEMDQYLFVNESGVKPISVQYVNRQLKKIMKKYGVKGNYSSHFMRKTLGRRVYEQNNESEKSLLLLSHLFNHASVSTTKIYLGIREEEIGNLYLTL